MGTIHGVTLLEERYLDNASALGLGGFRLMRKVIFPGALPMIFSGAGMALVFSFILLTVAEMFGAKAGWDTLSNITPIFPITRRCWPACSSCHWSSC